MLLRSMATGMPNCCSGSSRSELFGTAQFLMPVKFGARHASHLMVRARQSNGSKLRRARDQEQVVVTKPEETVSVPAENYIPGASSNYIGSPLLWIGVGVGISVLFSLAANYVKKQAMQYTLKSMLGGSGTSPFGNMSGGSPFPFPVTAPLQAPQTTTVTAGTVKRIVEPSAPSKPAENGVQKESAEPQTASDPALEDQARKEAEQEPVYFKDTEVEDSGSTFGWKADGTSTSGSSADSSSDGNAGSYFTVDALEKMLEDPTVQKMIYPYFPEEMRNPGTLKWMMQNPQIRAQLEQMLSSMPSDGQAWNSGQMADLLKNFNPNSQELKEQFEQIGLSPEEVMAKMLANPDIAMAFQNPKIQAALLDCSQNPANIQKYQNDKEVMDVFNKIAELFPIK